MSKINIPLDGHINVPFQMLLDDPLLVLKKFPMVATLEAHGPLDYFMVTEPFALTNTIRLRRRWHINLQVDAENQKLLWLPTPTAEGDGCDGWIEGECYDGGNGRTRVVLSAVMEHRFLNAVTTAIYKNAIHQAGYNFLMGFEKNFRNPLFENTVPAWTGQ